MSVPGVLVTYCIVHPPLSNRLIFGPLDQAVDLVHHFGICFQRLDANSLVSITIQPTSRAVEQNVVTDACSKCFIPQAKVHEDIDNGCPKGHDCSPNQRWYWYQRLLLLEASKLSSGQYSRVHVLFR